MYRILTVVLFFAFFCVPKTYAGLYDDGTPTCPDPVARTDPTPLISDSKQGKAQFFVNVGNNATFPDGWKMEFECGMYGRQSKNTAAKEGSTEISVSIDHNMFSCEFNPEQINTIKVFGIKKYKALGFIDREDEIPYCRAYYRVDNSDKQCKLSLAPSTGITPLSTLKISGDNLTKNKDWGLFIDENIVRGIASPKDIAIGWDNRPIRDDFTLGNAITVPGNLMTQGKHTISLRLRRLDIQVLPVAWLSTPWLYTSPLCSLTYRVGTPDDPGSVIADSPPQSQAGPPADAGGKDAPGCTKNANNPGIATAIGCIHTNPTELVKDFMKFGVGIGGGLAFLMMLLGAFQMLTSAGNPETLNAGKERLTSAIIGLLIVIFAVLLLQIIGVDILVIPGFKR